MISLFDQYIKEEFNLEEDFYLENLVGLFLLLISTFKDNFYKNYEDELYPIYAEIISFIDNPQCSCKIKIAHYIEDHYLEIYKLIRNWIENYKNYDFYDEKYDNILSQFFKTIEKKNLLTIQEQKFKGLPNTKIGNYMLGKVVTIEDTPEEFNNLILYLKENNYYYNHMSVIKDNNKIKIYFA